MRFARNTKIFRGQLDVAPFAGVFFLLVIFLLLNTAMVFTPGVPIQLPDALFNGDDSLAGSPNRTVVVAVDESGHFYFENQVIGREQLRERLQSAVSESRQPLTLVVQADKKVKIEELLPLWLLARSAGVKEIIQATRPSIVPAAKT